MKFLKSCALFLFIFPLFLFSESEKEELPDKDQILKTLNRLLEKNASVMVPDVVGSCRSDRPIKAGEISSITAQACPDRNTMKLKRVYRISYTGACTFVGGEQSYKFWAFAFTDSKKVTNSTRYLGCMQ